MVCPNEQVGVQFRVQYILILKPLHLKIYKIGWRGKGYVSRWGMRKIQEMRIHLHFYPSKSTHNCNIPNLWFNCLGWYFECKSVVCLSATAIWRSEREIGMTVRGLFIKDQSNNSAQLSFMTKLFTVTHLFKNACWSVLCKHLPGLFKLFVFAKIPHQSQSLSNT